MKKLYLIALTLILILLIAAFPKFDGITGMVSLGTSGCGKKDTGLGRAYIGGSQGLIANFRSGEPPDKILDEVLEPFTIAFEVENKGEFTVDTGEATIVLSGINVQDFGLEPVGYGAGGGSISSNVNPILGRVKIGNDIMEPASGEILFDSPGGYNVDLEQDFSTKIRADLCYFYNTEAVANLCLKFNPIQRRPELDVCRIDASKSVENSGSPVHFENFRESRSGTREVRFSVDIINVGGGDVFSSEEYIDDTPCIEDLESGSMERGLVKDWIYVGVVPQTTSYNIRCSSLERPTPSRINIPQRGFENAIDSGYVKLINGKTRIDCVVGTEAAQDTAFEIPVKLVAAYSYRTFIEKPITVENAQIEDLEESGGLLYT